MTPTPLIQPSGTPQPSLSGRFGAVRARTAALAAPLSPEDCAVQSMPDASPVKWHLAHSSWFFEQFVLVPHLPGYRVFDEGFGYLFNSYYEAVGPRHERPARGLLTRPSLEQVLAYRRHVDEEMARLGEHRPDAAVEALVELGLQHEQQHQELILMDVKHLFSCNPLKPSYIEEPAASARTAVDKRFLACPEGLYEVGFDGDGFSFDNERPCHRVYLQPYAIADRLVGNADYLQFIRDGGYERPELWLSDGWAHIRAHGWTRPLYWSDALDSEFTLSGMQPLDPAAPVCHVSFYEADAFARWANARLPTEAEWEAASSRFEWGERWEHTGSAYLPYPGYAKPEGAIGEYNGKFMANQMVLRGGSIATPAGHSRATYRNFFYPHMRWQFSGIRLAKDAQ